MGGFSEEWWQEDTEMRVEAIADELEALQAEQNFGRGVACVRSIVNWLRDGNTDKALAEARWDWDKIRNYPDIAQAMIDHLLGENPDKF